MDVGAVMDEVAGRLRQAPSLAGERTFAYPPGSVAPPAAIVSYPSDITFDAAYRRGMDRMTLSVVVVVGKPTDRTCRDQLAKYVKGDGDESVKQLVDGNGGSYTSCDVAVVAGAEFDVVNIGGADYLAAVFTINIAG